MDGSPSLPYEGWRAADLRNGTCAMGEFVVCRDGHPGVLREQAFGRSHCLAAPLSGLAFG